MVMLQRLQRVVPPDCGITDVAEWDAAADDEGGEKQYLSGGKGTAEFLFWGKDCGRGEGGRGLGAVKKKEQDGGENRDSG